MFAKLHLWKDDTFVWVNDVRKITVNDSSNFGFQTDSSDR